MSTFTKGWTRERSSMSGKGAVAGPMSDQDEAQCGFASRQSMGFPPK